MRALRAVGLHGTSNRARALIEVLNEIKRKLYAILAAFE
jgi:hypothetical protein